MEKHLKEIAKELRLIRLELEEMNGIQLTDGGPKVNIKALERRVKLEQRLKSQTLREGV